MLFAAALAACGTSIDGRLRSIAFVVPSKLLPGISMRGRLLRRNEFDCVSNSIYNNRVAAYDFSHTSHLLAVAVDNDDVIDHYVAYAPLSELDAVMILRASSSLSTEREACQSASDVLCVLGQASSSYSSSTLLLPTLNDVECIIDDVGSNVAVAALRRLCSPPFLPLSSFLSSSLSTDRRRQAKRHRESITRDDASDDASMERNVYEKMMQLLLKKIVSSVEDQCMAAVNASSSINPSQYINARPALLPFREVLPSVNTDDKKTLNWYGMVDVLFSLSNLMYILGIHHRNEGRDIIAGHLITNISPKEQVPIVDLFENVIQVFHGMIHLFDASDRDGWSGT